MAIKTILLHLTDDPRRDVRTKLAVSFAQQHGAHLIGTYTSPPFEVPVQMAGLVPPDVFDRQRDLVKKDAKLARQDLESLCAKQDVTCEWREVEGDAADVMKIQARYADLTVIGQVDPDEPTLADDGSLSHELVMGAAGPVMVVPYAGKFRQVGNRILVAWNGTREAARAVRDSLPLMEGAKKVIIFSVNPTKRDHIPGADIATRLARHGIKVEVAHTVARDIDVGDALLDALTDRSCDMLVMGAYGHSRFRELVLGGATRHILKQMTVPVVLTH